MKICGRVCLYKSGIAGYMFLEDSKQSEADFTRTKLQVICVTHVIMYMGLQKV